MLLRKTTVMYPDADVDVEFFDKINESKGSLGTENVEDKLMKSVLSNDKQKIEEGKVIQDAINNGISSFMPEVLFENLVKRYQMTKNLYGERLLRKISGYDADYIERNNRIPEFQQQLKKNIRSKINSMMKDGLIDKEGTITQKGFEIAAVVMYLEELENLKTQGIIGDRINKKTSVYGERDDVKDFRKGIRYKDIDIRSTIKLAVKRGHKKIELEDIKAVQRKAKGSVEIIYAIDASASMKGKKVEMAKKAGVALAYKAIEEKNKVGLIVFGDEVKEEIMPTHDFGMLLQHISRVRASMQTNIARTLARSYELFSRDDATKHLILITDALPTEGDDPIKDTLDACYEMEKAGITISIIGIDLNKEGKKLAEDMAEIGKGRLYVAKDIENLDMLVLEDYAEQK